MERRLTTDCPRNWMLASEAPHPCPCPLAFPNIPPAFPNLEAAPRTQPWDSNVLLRPSACASEWTLRHLYKFLRLQAWRCAHLPTPGTSNIRKFLWLLKLPLINLAPSTSFLGLSLLSVGPVLDFTPKGPEVMNRHQQFHSWEHGRISGPGGQEVETLRRAPWEEWNLPTETYWDWFPINAWLQKTETYLLTNKYLPKIFPLPQVSELAAWILLDTLLFVFLAHGYNPPQTLNDLPVTCTACIWGVAITLLFLKKKLNFCSFELASVDFFIWVHRYRSKGIESRDSLEICTTVFVVTLFTVANRQNQPKQGPIKRWMGKQNVAVYTM